MCHIHTHTHTQIHTHRHCHLFSQPSMLGPSFVRREAPNLLFLYLLRTSTAVVAPPERPAAWARGFAGVAFHKDRTEMKNDHLSSPSSSSSSAAAAAAAGGDPGNLFLRPSPSAFGRGNGGDPRTAGSSTGVSTATAATSAKSASYAGTLMAPPDVCIRNARREDIPQIEACNLKTLPENYPNAFYHNHLLQWPYLALVAERRPTGEEEEMNGNSNNHNNHNDNGKKIVGYVLGRVQVTGGNNNNGLPTPVSFEDSGLPGVVMPAEAAATFATTVPGRKTGHVSSLAVLDEYRRLGIAKELMEILHWQMKFRYGVECSTLHVRCSNRGAQKLYVNSLGYRIVETVGRYYQDGADAYYMKIDLNPQAEESEEEEAILAMAGHGHRHRHTHAHAQQQQQQQQQAGPKSGITMREKEAPLVTEDSQGYFKLYQQPAGGAKVGGKQPQQ